MPVIPGDVSHSVGLHACGAAVFRVPGAETNCPEGVHRLESPVSVRLVDVRETADTEPSAVYAARGPRRLPILFREEAHPRSKEMASILSIEGAVTTIATATADRVPAKNGKALATTGEIEW